MCAIRLGHRQPDRPEGSAVSFGGSIPAGTVGSVAAVMLDPAELGLVVPASDP